MQLAAEQVERIRAIASSELGYEGETVSASVAQIAAGRRARTLGVSISSYADTLLESRGERRALCQELLVVESWLFRETEPIVVALKALRAQKDELQVLSVPCARGEEPISVLGLALQAGFAAERVSVVGVDISESALEHARRFELPAYSFRGSLAGPVTDLFEMSASGPVLRAAYRPSLRYLRANVTDRDWLPPHGAFDLILCRNLLVYLSPHARGDLLTKLAQSLSQSGILIVAASEAGVVPSNILRPVSLHPVLYRQSSIGDPAPTERGYSLAVDTARASSRARGEKVNRGVVPPEKISRAAKQPTSSADQLDLELQVNSLDHEAAFLLLLEIIDRDPNNAQAHMLLGSLFSASGQRELAADCLRRALEIEPTHSEALLLLRCVLEVPGEDKRV